jgi:hypothetical protein
VRYILVRNLSTISIVMSDRLAVSAGPQVPGLHIALVEKVAHLRTRPAGLRQHSRDNTNGATSISTEQFEEGHR